MTAETKEVVTLARQDDIVRMPEVNPKVEPLLAIMPKGWQNLGAEQLRQVVSDLLSRPDWPVKLELKEALKLLRFRALCLRLYESKCNAKEIERRTRLSELDLRKFRAAV